jgi:hypothetical protein
MQFNLIGLAVMSDDPTSSAQWFVDHFGFEIGGRHWLVRQHPAPRPQELQP